MNLKAFLLLGIVVTGAACTSIDEPDSGADDPVVDPFVGLWDGVSAGYGLDKSPFPQVRSEEIGDQTFEFTTVLTMEVFSDVLVTEFITTASDEFGDVESESTESRSIGRWSQTADATYGFVLESRFDGDLEFECALDSVDEVSCVHAYLDDEPFGMDFARRVE
jgi:hypothetical protein